jgi:hypothetical protein
MRIYAEEVDIAASFSVMQRFGRAITIKRNSIQEPD